MKLAIVLISSIVMLGCVQTPSEKISYGNDGLPSAEVIAFQEIDARLKYRDARIEFDSNECPVYQGIASDGQVRRVPLLNPQGQPICDRFNK